MRNSYLIAILVAGSLSTAAHSETVRTSTRVLRVKYSDGAQETYLAKYSATFSSRIWEEGHPSVPLKGDFTDTRRCHWEAHAAIEREACLTAHSGRAVCPKELTRVYERPVVNQGTGGWSIADGPHPENCGSARPRAEQEIEGARQSMLAQMPTVIQSDRSVLRGELSQDSQVVSLDDVTPR